MNDSCVYFVVRASDGLIKIGVTRNLEKRLRTLRGLHGELQLLADEPGFRWDEARLHRIFKHLRVYGEWFQAAEELLAYICLLREDEPLDAAPNYWYAQVCVARYALARAA